MKKIGQILLMVLIVGSNSMGQGLHFSQWYEAPLLLNPASAGSYFGDYRANINYRNQWGSVGNGFETVFASYDMPIKKNKQDMKTTGVGVHFYNDKAGKSNYGRTEGTFSLSQSVSVSKELDLAVGLGFAYGQVSGNFNNLKWDNQYDGTKYDPSLGTGENVFIASSSYFDLNMGFLARFIGRKKNETNIGFSAANLTQSRQATLSLSSSDKRRTRFILHAKSEIPLENRDDFFVPTLFISNQSASTEIALGGTYKLNLGLQSSYTGYYNSSFLEFGAIYRYQDAIVAIVKFDWEQRIQLGASYDVNVSKFNPATNFQGGFEISLVYKGAF